MFSNLSITEDNARIAYPISDSKLPFSEYIALTTALIEERRTDLTNAGNKAPIIIQANKPFELYPVRGISDDKRAKYGALLIHGLLDCAFSLKDIAKRLQTNGILSRALLLPGHGTRASDLTNISYHQWLQAVRYGVETLAKEVDYIYLVGYSTGATLALYEAIQDARITGVVLLSPAIRIKAPVDIAVAWYKLLHAFNPEKKQWMYIDDEVDYTKYRSIPFNAVAQVAQLTRVIHELRVQQPITAPIFMVMSREDETISSHSAINFFSSQQNQESKLLLYSSIDHRYPDPRITTRLSSNKAQNIKHFSHSCLPFSPDNTHYGVDGDYHRVSELGANKFIYGAYNKIEERAFGLLNALRLTRFPRRELTFNPDFDYMANEIVKFITGTR